MLKDIAKKYYHNGYNCAEAMLYAGNEYYQLDLSPQTYKLMAGFGGGANIEDICGVVSGSIALLGIIFVEKRASESKEIKEITQDFINRFKEEMGTINCKELKGLYREEKEKCSPIVEKGAVILENIIEKYRIKYPYVIIQTP